MYLGNPNESSPFDLDQFGMSKWMNGAQNPAGFGWQRIAGSIAPQQMYRGGSMNTNTNPYHFGASNGAGSYYDSNGNAIRDVAGPGSLRDRYGPRQRDSNDRYNIVGWKNPRTGLTQYGTQGKGSFVRDTADKSPYAFAKRGTYGL